MTTNAAQRLRDTFPVFQAMPEAVASAILAETLPLRAPAGAAMFEAGSPCQAFPMLLSGSIRVSKTAENGRELLLYRVTPGEACILTSSCLLGNTAYSARGIAESELDGLVLPKPVFNRLVEEQPAFRDYIFGLFSARLVDLMGLVEEVAFRRVDQRLAGILAGKREDVLSITHQALADELGSAREIVSRVLKGFEDQGWVSLGRQQIRIQDPRALRHFSACAL